jgi:hypothetical protein
MRALSTRLPGGSDLEIKAAIPMNLACYSTNLSPNPLYIISGVAGITSLACAQHQGDDAR